MVAEVGELSTRARALQYELRLAAPSASYARVRARVAKERKSLQRLVSAMGEAAPSLRICRPDLAACECTPDASLMAIAARQAESAQSHLAALDAAMASGRAGFEALLDGPRGLAYPGGAVERELEEICEAPTRTSAELVQVTF